MAFRTSLIYWLAGATWILVSDSLLGLLGRGETWTLWMQSVKGWAFVTVTAVLLYLVLRRQFQRLREREHERAEAEQRYRSVVNDLPALVCRFRPDGTIEFVNEACADCFGKNSADLLGTNFMDLLPEAGRPSVSASIQRLDAARPLTRHEHEVVGADGSRRIQRWTLRAILGGGGEVVSLQAFGEDITDQWRADRERRLAEDRWRRLFNASPLPTVLYAAADGRIVDVNDRFVEIFKLGREDAIGRTGLQLGLWCDPAQRAEFLAQIERSEAVHGYEARFKNASGEEFEMLLTARIVELDTGPAVLVKANDVTARKNAERSLRRAVERAELAQKAVGASLYEYLPSAGEVFRDPTLTLVFGYAPDEVESTRGGWRALIHADDTAAFDAGVDEALRTAHAFSLEYRVRHKAGHYVWVADQARLFRDAGGQVERVVGMVRNITATKEAEAALTASETRYRGLAENSAVGIWQIDTAGHTAYANPTMCRMLELNSPDELRGCTFHEFFTPESLEVMKRAHAKRIEGLPSQYEVELTGRRGGRLHVLISGAPLTGTDGKLQGLIGTFVDVTQARQTQAALRESEERFQAFMNQSPVVAWIKDEEFKFRYVNSSFGTLFQLPPDQILGRTDYDVYARESADETRANDRRVLESDAIIEAVESVPGADGRMRQWLVQKFPLHRSGHRTWVGGTAVDITERREAENALQSLVQGTTAVGGEFLQSLVRELAAVLEVRHALVGRLLPGKPERVQTVVFWSDGRLAANVAYSLAGTPCANVAGKELCHYPTGVAGMFPGDQLLEEMGVDSYLGAPLFASDRHPVGLLVIMHDRPIARPELAHSLLRIFASRAAAELERQETERALRESELRYRTLAEASPVGIWHTDPEGQTLFLNRAMCVMLEIDDPEKMAGRNFRDFCTPDSLKLAEQEHSRSHQGVASAYEMELIGLRGGRRHVVVRSAPLQAPDGAATSAIATLTDITELRQAEKALRESEERKAAIFDNTLDALVTIDAQGVVVEWNRAAESIFGFTRAAALGRPLDELIVPPHMRERHRKGMQRLLETGNSQLLQKLIEMPALRADGSEFPAELFIAPTSREPRLFTGFLRDITARRQAEEQLRLGEERLRLAVEGARLGTWEVDRLTRRIVWGGLEYELFGVQPAGFNGTSDAFFKLIHPEDLAAFHESTEQGVRSGQPYRVDYRIIRPDNGQTRWLRSVGRAECGADGNPRWIRGVTYDVTELRNLEAQLLQAQKMEAMGSLAGGIAHDFNNILTAILGNAELARWVLTHATPASWETEARPSLESGLDEITKAGSRAKSLVRQILTFSRQQPQDRKVIPLAPVVEECFNLLRATIPTSVDLRKEIRSGAPDVLADPTKIHQVIVNLCTNAWHALVEGRGTITMTLEPVQVTPELAGLLAGLRTGPHARISVCDTGCGMDEITRAKVFEPFFTTKPPGQGTGLGLSVVHGIVQSHDGVIDLRTLPGVGTTFDLYFPAATGNRGDSSGSEPASLNGTGQRVLVLDDEEAVARLANRMLERLGYRAQCFTRAADALRAFREAPQDFDICITDYNMPGRSGLDVAREFLSIRPSIRVIINSGYLSEELVRQARDAGVAGVLIKPNTLAELGTALHDALTSSVDAHEP